MELKHNLHIRAASGMPAPYLPLCADNRCRTHGVWKNNGRKLVSGGTRKSGRSIGHPHQCIFG